MNLHYQMSHQDTINFLIYQAQLDWSRSWMSYIVIGLALLLYIGSSIYWYHKGIYFIFLGVMFVVITILFSWRRILIYFSYRRYSKEMLNKIIDYELDFDKDKLVYKRDFKVFNIAWNNIKSFKVIPLGGYFGFKIYLHKNIDGKKKLLIPIPKKIFDNKFSYEDFLVQLKLYTNVT